MFKPSEGRNGKAGFLVLDLRKNSDVWWCLLVLVLWHLHLPNSILSFSPFIFQPNSLARIENCHINLVLPDMSATSDQKESSFNILGSSKLNTPDGKNPPISAPTTSKTQTSQAAEQLKTDDYKSACRSAHDALEDKLRDAERESKWSGRW